MHVVVVALPLEAMILRIHRKGQCHMFVVDRGACCNER